MYKIGEGAEGVIFRSGDRAIKLFKESPKNIEATVRLSKLKLDRIVAPKKLIYLDNKFIGYVMDYVSDASNPIYIKKQELLDSIEAVREDIFKISDVGVVMGDVIPKNTLLSDNKLYFIDTSLYTTNDVEPNLNIRINEQVLDRYVTSLVNSSTGNILDIKFLRSVISNYYHTIVEEMSNEETMEQFAKRLVKEKRQLHK